MSDAEQWLTTEEGRDMKRYRYTTESIYRDLAEARKLMKAARENHVCKCSDCAAIDSYFKELGL